MSINSTCLSVYQVTKLAATNRYIQESREFCTTRGGGLRCPNLPKGSLKIPNDSLKVEDGREVSHEHSFAQLLLNLPKMPNKRTV